MAKLDRHLKKELLKYMGGIKEDHRDPDTGILDTRGMVVSALELWNQDDPDACAEYKQEAPIYTGAAEYEKDAQSKRSNAHRGLAGYAATIHDEDFDASSVDAWQMPSPGELGLEYHVPMENNGMVPERLGDMTVPQVFSMAQYHENREYSAAKQKRYFRRVGYIALFWKKRKSLGDEATLWEIFEGNENQAV